MDIYALLPPVTMASLWLPIVVSTVAVFFASFLVWMVLPHHRKDFAKVPDEDELVAHLRSQDLGPGNYAFPHCSDPAQFKDEAFKQRFEIGPSGFLTIRRGSKLSMGRELTQWFVYVFAISVMVAYVTTRTELRIPGHDELGVFRVAGTAAFLAYSAAVIPQAIWKSLRWSTVWKEVLDGLGYALLTGAAFGWLS